MEDLHRVYNQIINETGGYFGGWEEDICKAFCKTNGYTYRVEYRDLGY